VPGWPPSLSCWPSPRPSRSARAPQIDPSEIQLQAAVNKATVEGDLKGAILDFQKILNTPGVSRPVAANALLHLGQCHEKLGSAEARSSYERVLKDFADQGDVVRQARERLATLAKTAAPFPEDALKGRRIIGPLYTCAWPSRRTEDTWRTAAACRRRTAWWFTTSRRAATR